MTDTTQRNSMAPITRRPLKTRPLTRRPITRALSSAMIALLSLGLLGSASAQAQSKPGPIVLEGATIHTVSGAKIEEGSVVLGSDGTILAVGKSVTKPAGAQVIDVKGKVITPGLIDAASGLGLVEIWAAKDTRDRSQETEDPVRAAFRASDAFNPAASAIALSRAAGITSSALLPSGGLCSGQVAWIDLHAPDDKHEQARVTEQNLGLVFTMGARAARKTGSRGATLRDLRELYADVQFFAQNQGAFDQNRSRRLKSSRVDLQALQTTLQGQRPVLLRVHRADEIKKAVLWAKKANLRPIVLGAHEGWKVAKFLAEQKVPVILDGTENLPRRFESNGARADNAALLARAGVQIAISTFDSHNLRRLRQNAGKAVRAGLPHADALRAITLNPANIYGKAKRYGALAKGMRANLVIWSGDPLELSTKVEAVYIDGQKTNLQHRQQQLFERYKTLPRRDTPTKKDDTTKT